MMEADELMQPGITDGIPGAPVQTAAELLPEREPGPGEQDAGGRAQGPSSEQVAHAVGQVAAYLRFRGRPELADRWRQEYEALVVPILKLVGFDDVTYLLYAPTALPDWLKLALGGLVLVGGALAIRVEEHP